MMSKIYVVDTNIIMQHPDFPTHFDDSCVFLVPHSVIMELDSQKKGSRSSSRNIRKFASYLDTNKYPNVFIDYTQSSKRYVDDQLVDITNQLQTKAETKEIVLLTNDVFLRVIARTSKVSTESFDFTPPPYKMYEGLTDAKTKELDMESLGENEYVIQPDGLYKHKAGKLKRIGKDTTMWGLSHKNVAQRCAIDALTDDSIHLVTLVGPAGSGKTLLSLAAALEKTLESKKYKKIMVARPIMPLGNDIGYLPGTVAEKLEPWMQPIHDNISFLFGEKSAEGKWLLSEEDDVLQMEPLTYIRGRSIRNQFVIIDEAQNLTRHEAKTIVSRLGEGSKIILTGDVHQIDNASLNAENNGLAYLVEKFKNQSIAAHIVMNECERSKLAEVAANIL